jgi:hypothetical protein
VLQATYETSTSHPDTEISEMGRRLTELNCKASVRLRRLGQHQESDAAYQRMSAIAEEEGELEWRVIYTPVDTPEGYEEKLRILDRLGFGFDPDVLAEVVWLLAHEAGRLGIASAMPKRLKSIFARAVEQAA